LSARCSRFLRAKLQRFCQAGLLLADDPRVLTAWKRGWDGSHHVRLLRWRDEGFHPKAVYDIGAHAGFWSEMAQAVYSPDRIFLFEPQRALQEQARARQPAGAVWEVVPAALGDREEIQWINVTENAAASSLLPPEAVGMESWGTRPMRREEVSVMRLDRLASTRNLPPPDLVKIDVQGYERPVLAGGRETLAQAQRIVIEVSLLEIYQGQPLLPEVAEILAGWGFEIEDISEACRLWPGPVSQVDLWWKKAR
jgi:FkbM family methyltransferase